MMEPTNSGNSEKLTTVNHMPNATTTPPLEPPSGENATLPLTNDQTDSHSNLHQTSSVTENGNETLINNPFVEPHISALENSSSQNPFLLHSDDMHVQHSSFTPSTHESSSENPFQVPINTTSSSQNVVENHDHEHELHHHVHDPMHSNTTKEDTNAHQEFGKDFHVASESSDDDTPISSKPNQGQQNKGLEIQNPPIQVMERSEDSATSSTPRIPLNIFTRNKSNAQWSTTSNESLFSIQMGNMSFSNDMVWLNNKSGEFDPKPSDMPLLPSQEQQPLTKFNNISQCSAAQQHECLRVTEQKAAETMREVIMETSVNTGNNKSDKGNLTFDNSVTRSGRISSSNDHSHHSDGSTKSFAFKV